MKHEGFLGLPSPNNYPLLCIQDVFLNVEAMTRLQPNIHLPQARFKSAPNNVETQIMCLKIVDLAHENDGTRTQIC